MQKFKWITPARIRHILMYLTAILLPLAFKYILNAATPVYVIILLAACKFILEAPRFFRIPARIKLISRIISAAYSLLFALVLLAGVVITPYSVYAFFFEAAAEPLTDQYFVAGLFVLLLCFFTQFFCSAALKQQSYKPLLGLAGILCGLLLIIFQNVLLLVLLLTCLILYAIVLFKKRTLYLVNIFILCSGFSLIFLAINHEPGGSALVDEFAFPRTRKFINTRFPGFPLLIDIPGYSKGFSSGKLGGMNILTSTPVFEVTGDRWETIYLKTNAYDIYKNSTWFSSTTYTTDPAPVSKEEILLPGTNPRLLGIRILGEVFPLVPFTDDTIGFRQKNQYYKINSSIDWPGVELTDSMRRNSLITLYRYPGGEVQDPEKPPQFLQVPADLSQKIRDLAGDLGSTAASPREVLNKIQDYLAAHYTYNLDAPKLRADEDFLEKFLFQDQTGYCTHFATAFVILARLNKIHARYVNGYLVYLHNEEIQKTVTARSAHAWAEVWLPGEGWQRWEATRAVNREYYEEQLDGLYMDYLSRYFIRGNEIARNALTLDQLRELLGIDFRFPGEEQQDRTPAWVEKLRYLAGWLAIILLAGLAAVCLFFAVRYFVFRRDPVKVLLNRLVKTYRLAPLPEKKGWVHWTKHVCRIYRIDQARADRLLAVVLKLAYSKQAVSREELQFARGFRKKKTGLAESA